jgi:hypothetical protein
MDDPNSEYWEAQYYKYKYLYLEATGRWINKEKINT